MKRVLLVAGLVWLLSVVSWAQTGGIWRVVNLNPTNAQEAYASGVSGSQQVGYLNLSGSLRAGLWSGESSTFVDLHPENASSSAANSVFNGRQVGWAVFNGSSRATLWSGAANTSINLHPSGRWESEATGISDSQQVGYTYYQGREHAALWSGSAGSFFDLHRVLPAYFSSSSASGIEADAEGNLIIVGWGYNANTRLHDALMWTYNARIPGDVNDDGCVDDTDLALVIFAFGQSHIAMTEDLNGDGIVDDTDLSIVIFNFGSGC